MNTQFFSGVQKPSKTCLLSHPVVELCTKWTWSTSQGLFLAMEIHFIQTPSWGRILTRRWLTDWASSDGELEVGKMRHIMHKIYTFSYVLHDLLTSRYQFRHWSGSCNDGTSDEHGPSTSCRISAHWRGQSIRYFHRCGSHHHQSKQITM